MSDELAVVHGSGNVFRDLGMPNPEALQLKAKLAAQIIKVLDKRALTGRGAHEVTGVAAADFSRIRKAKLARFTIDRLMSILEKLDQDVEINVTVRPRRNAVAETRRLA